MPRDALGDFAAVVSAADLEMAFAVVSAADLSAPDLGLVSDFMIRSGGLVTTRGDIHGPIRISRQ
jgi:hypothetical protein